MKGKQISLVLLVLLLAFGLTLVGCPNGDDNGGGGGSREIKVPGNNVKEKLTWLKTYDNIKGKAGSTFIIEINANEPIPAGNDLTYPDSPDGITIILRNTDRYPSVLNASTGTAPLFSLIANVTLILEDGIILSGLSGMNATVSSPLVAVASSSTLEMKPGSFIRNHTLGAGTSGGGVSVDGTFNMNGGTISGNRANQGGGVYVGNNGIFTMTDGEIFGCSSWTGTGTSRVPNGGGVYVETGGTLRIVKGIIYGSDATDVSKRNTVPSGTTGTGAALYLDTTGAGGKAERGTLSGDTWTKTGDLTTTNNSISVANGQLL